VRVVEVRVALVLLAAQLGNKRAALAA